MNKLVLGVGDWSKRYLEPKEPRFRDWHFGVLDCWSHVQIVDIIEEEVEHAGGGIVKFMRDLSYFTAEPDVAVRLGEEKYAWSQTGKVLKLPHLYREKLRTLLPENLPAVVESCKSFDQLFIVMATSELIALEWLPYLLKHIDHSNTRVQILSAFPADWEGGKACAEEVCDQVRNFPVEHFVFYQQELAQHYGQRTLKEYLDASEPIFAEAMKQMLKGGVPKNRMIRKSA